MMRGMDYWKLKLNIGDNTILTLFNDKDLHNSKKIITFAL